MGMRMGIKMRMRMGIKIKMAEASLSGHQRLRLQKFCPDKSKLTSEVLLRRYLTTALRVAPSQSAPRYVPAAPIQYSCEQLSLPI